MKLTSFILHLKTIQLGLMMFIIIIGYIMLLSSCHDRNKSYSTGTFNLYYLEHIEKESEIEELEKFAVSMENQCLTRLTCRCSLSD